MWVCLAFLCSRVSQLFHEKLHLMLHMVHMV